jgi:ubiquinone/menaquinone biosynthesis C-methylase UbiE
MSNPIPPRPEHSGTYFVQDRSNQEELARLQIQDQMVTTGMGGVLPEQPDPTIFQRVLDVGCGTGGWIIEVAKTYPSISLLVGVDANPRTIKYAQSQAEAQGVSDRVQFRMMDAIRKLEFDTDFFHLVNQRFGASYLRTWDWPNLLLECQRVIRPGGGIRITESDYCESSTPALTRLYHMLSQAFHQSGHLFAPDKSGVASELARMLRQYGFQNVQTRTHLLEYRAGTAEGQLFYEDTKRVFRTIVPFFHKWSSVPEDYEEIYQQMLSELQQPDCVARWSILTAWGKKRDA